MDERLFGKYINTMKLIIDNSNLFAGGGIQVAMSFLKDLKHLELNHEYYIIQSPNMAKAIHNIDFPKNFHFYHLSENTINNKRERIKEVINIENEVKPDCIFTVFGPSYHKSNYPKLVGFAIGHIIYPESPFFKTLSIKEKIYNKILCHIKTLCFNRNSDALVFETQDAATLYKQNKSFKKPVHVANNTLNEIFHSPKEWEKFPEDLASPCTILCVTANYAHKNLSIIPHVIDNLINKYKFHDFQFVLTLDPTELEVSEYHRKYIKFIGRVTINQLPDVYSQSNIVFMPTLLELFSATYLEAMFMKRAIVASDLGFSKDICQDSAYFCEATNPEAYADAIYKLYTQPEINLELIQKGETNLKRFGTSIDRTKKYLKITQEMSKKT